MEKMWEVFKTIGEPVLVMSHYDLANEYPQFSTEEWKRFLITEEVSDWIKEEIMLVQEVEMKRTIRNIGNSNSVGKAQIINTLSKLLSDRQDKEGPIFIYTYVPLNEEQKHAENVKILEVDPFRK